MGLFRTCWRNDHCKRVCWIGTVTGLVAGLVVVVIIGVRYGRYNERAALHMTPGDTRLITYSSKFCESLTLKNTGLPNNFNTTLVTVGTKPELSVNATDFQISVIDLTLNYGLYQFWKFYLYPGSTFGLRACILNGQGMELDIVSGSNFDAWLKAPGSYQHLEKKFTITTLCSSGTMQSNNYTFESEDEYYFAFIGINDASEGINATLDFTSPEYVVNETFIKSCSTGRQSIHGHSCKISVPYDSDSYGLILVEDISLGTYASSAAVDVEWMCNPRVWLYAVIALSPVAFVIVLCLVVVAACWCVKNRRLSKYIPLRKPEQVHVSTANGAGNIVNYGVIEKNT